MCPLPRGARRDTGHQQAPKLRTPTKAGVDGIVSEQSALSWKVKLTPVASSALPDDIRALGKVTIPP